MLQPNKPYAAWIALLFAMIATPGVSHGQDASRAVRRGERLVSAHCVMCHATRGGGASSHREAPELAIVLQRYPVESLQESLTEGLTSGHPDMPVFRFSDGDAAAILAYLRSIQRR